MTKFALECPKCDSKRVLNASVFLPLIVEIYEKTELCCMSKHYQKVQHFM